MRINNFNHVLAFILLMFSSLVFASGTINQPLKLIDQPTAGTYNKGAYGLSFNFFNEGGIGYSFGLGITDRFSIGIAHELMGAIGSGKIEVQSIPGIMIKYRFIEESYYLPGFAAGFESQGDGNFYNHRNDVNYPRFEFKSKGFYGAISKSYLFLGQPLGFHGIVNYSTLDNQAESEGPTKNNKPSNRVLNSSIGIDKAINGELSLLLEYDLAFDDNHKQTITKGYLNTAIRWTIFPSFTVELAIKDLLHNKELPYKSDGVLREIRITHSSKF